MRALLILCSPLLCGAYPDAPNVPALDPGLEPAPSPLPPTGESSAAPAADALNKCAAVPGAAVNDEWCERSCNAALPSCPAAYCTCEGGNPTIPGAAPRTGSTVTNIEPPTQICTSKDHYGKKKCRNLNTEEINEWKSNEQKRHAHEREGATEAREAEEVQGNIERRGAMDDAEAASDAVRAERDAEAEELRAQMEADAERQRQEMAAAASKIQDAVVERDAAAAQKSQDAVAERDAAVAGAVAEGTMQSGNITPAPQEQKSVAVIAPESTSLAPDWTATADPTESGAIVPSAVDAGLDSPALAAANAAAKAAAAEAVAAQKEAADNAVSPSRLLHSLAALVGAPPLVGAPTRPTSEERKGASADPR